MSRLCTPLPRIVCAATPPCRSVCAIEGKIAACLIRRGVMSPRQAHSVAKNGATPSSRVRADFRFERHCFMIMCKTATKGLNPVGCLAHRIKYTKTLSPSWRSHALTVWWCHTKMAKNIMSLISPISAK